MSTPVLIRTHQQGPKPTLDCDERENMTDPSYEEETNINKIMARYIAGQGLPLHLREANFEDFAEAPDFMEAQNILARANEQFAALPSNVRERFNNRPADFLAFVHDPANREEARRLNLLVPTPEPSPTTDKAPEAKP